MPGRTLQRIQELAKITDCEGELTRLCLSPGMREANELVRGWMDDAGMITRTDAAGNLIGRYGTGARALCIGSHLDTVRNAGRFDGALGVLAGIACVEAVRESKLSLPFQIEVAAFCDEEGVRFQTAYLGSAFFNGRFDPAWLALEDDAGVSIADALRAWGADPDAIVREQAPPRDLLGYVEMHIEQGPVLERADRACGVVHSICGQSRIHVVIEGKAGHAGNTPMNARQDALVAAALVVTETERCARAGEDLRATVGALHVEPNAANVIPGRVTFSLDIRHSVDDARDEAIRSIRALTESVCRERGLALTWTVRQETGTVQCDAGLTSLLESALTETQGDAPVLVSGAGHDAVSFRETCPIALLFVRCKDGLSHHPEESVTAGDIEAAEHALLQFVQALAARHV